MKKNKDMKKNIDAIKLRCQMAFDNYMEARDNAIRNIEIIVKTMGGFIPTLPCEDKPTLKATFSYGDEIEEQTIFGIRYVEEEGLFICVSDNVSDYEVERGYCFDYLYDFEGNDLKEIKKVLKDLSHYTPFDYDNIIRSATVISILGGLASYIK